MFEQTPHDLFVFYERRPLKILQLLKYISRWGSLGYAAV